MTPAGLVFGCGPAPAGLEVEAATFYITTQRLADRLIEAAASELADLANVVGLAELTAELSAIADEINVRVITESKIQAMAGEAVERSDREFAELNRTGGLKAVSQRYPSNASPRRAVRWRRAGFGFSTRSGAWPPRSRRPWRKPGGSPCIWSRCGLALINIEC
jgi:hypothetical protein